jgi:hypothetical protein
MRTTENDKTGDAHIAGSGAPPFGPSGMDLRGPEPSVRTAATSTREIRSSRLGQRICSSTIVPSMRSGRMVDDTTYLLFRVSLLERMLLFLLFCH